MLLKINSLEDILKITQRKIFAGVLEILKLRLWQYDTQNVFFHNKVFSHII